MKMCKKRKKKWIKQTVVTNNYVHAPNTKQVLLFANRECSNVAMYVYIYVCQNNYCVHFFGF